MVDFYKERYEAHYEKFGIEGSGGGDSKSIGLCELGILSKAGLKNFHSLLDFGCGIGAASRRFDGAWRIPVSGEPDAMAGNPALDG